MGLVSRSLKDHIDSLTSYLCGRSNSCGNKIKYSSQQSAMRACVKMEAKHKHDGKRFEFYHCWFCGKTHIGGALDLTIRKFFRILWFWIKKRIK